MRNPNKTSRLALLPIVAAASMVVAQTAIAHGFVSDPPGRAAYCQAGKNVNCGAVQYEPQSVEGQDGSPRFPVGGPADGQIASAGNTTWGALNEQTSDRWTKTDVTAGQERTFKWTFTAAHRTQDIRYFITKNGWNPNMPLTREQLETKPFCESEYGGALSSSKTSFSCKIPSDHSGYHVIVGVWDVADTSASFYNAIDVNIKSASGGDTPAPAPAWTQVGAINPIEALAAGDSVRTRVFNASGELTNLSASLTIGSAADGNSERWPYLLAQKINSSFSESYQAGSDADGSIKPVNGKNTIFAKPGSGITRVEIDITKKPAPSPVEQKMTVTPKSEYAISGTTAVVDPYVTLAKKGAVTGRVYNEAGTMVGTQTKDVDGSATLSINVASAKAGKHTLVMTTPDGNDGVIQQSYDLKLTGGALPDPTPTPTPDPDQKAPAYKAGTVYKGGDVVSNKGKLYVCKPLPYSGWCGQSAMYYEPGKGLAWQSAWTKK
jgi:chitin-binding protein